MDTDFPQLHVSAREPGLFAVASGSHTFRLNSPGTQALTLYLYCSMGPPEIPGFSEPYGNLVAGVCVRARASVCL